MNRSREFSLRSFRVLIFVFAAMLAGSLYSDAAASVGMNNANKKAQQEKRDPFWPVGYAPVIESKEALPVVERPVVVGSWGKAMKTIVINGVSSRSDNDFYAVINGEIKSVGDTVSVKCGGTIYTWAVDSIKPPNSVK